MKKIAKILCLVLALSLALALGACKKDPVPSTELPKDTATIYYLSGVVYGETVYGLEQMQISDPTQCYVFFDIYGTGKLRNFVGIGSREQKSRCCIGQSLDKFGHLVTKAHFKAFIKFINHQQRTFVYRER